MDQHTALWQALQQQLNHDLTTTSQLAELLERERQALETRNYDQFQHLIGEKNQLVSQLEANGKQRQQWIQSSGMSDERDALEQARQHNPALANLWETLADQWRQCQHNNAVNERVAQRTRLAVSQLLDTLRGQNGQQRLYTANGNAAESGSGNTITRA